MTSIVAQYVVVCDVMWLRVVHFVLVCRVCDVTVHVMSHVRVVADTPLTHRHLGTAQGTAWWALMDVRYANPAPTTMERPRAAHNVLRGRYQGAARRLARYLRVAIRGTIGTELALSAASRTSIARRVSITTLARLAAWARIARAPASSTTRDCWGASPWGQRRAWLLWLRGVLRGWADKRAWWGACLVPPTRSTTARP